MTSVVKPPPPSPAGGPSAGAAHPRLLKLSQLLGDLEADAARRTEAKTKGVPLGPVTGLKALDELLGGCLAPGLHVPTGGPGVGKTAFGLQIAASAGCPSVFVSAEMHVLELFRRVIARQTSTFLGDLKSGVLAPSTVVQKARQAIAALPDLAIVDATDAYASLEYLALAAEGARSVNEDGTGDVLVVVDSVHSWSAAAPGRHELTEYDRLSAALDGLRALARRLRCPVVAIAERNRMSMKDGGLSAAAGTRSFEYSSESVISLDVDEKATAPGPDERVIVARLEKNRHGPGHGKGLKLGFNGALQRFRDLEPGR